MATKKQREARQVLDQAYAELMRDIIRESTSSMDRRRERQATTRLSREKYDALLTGGEATVLDVEAHEQKATAAEHQRVVALIREHFADAIEYFAEHGFGLEEEDLAGRRAAMGGALDVLLGAVPEADAAGG